MLSDDRLSPSAGSNACATPSEHGCYSAFSIFLRAALNRIHLACERNLESLSERASRFSQILYAPLPPRYAPASIASSSILLSCLGAALLSLRLSGFDSLASDVPGSRSDTLRLSAPRDISRSLLSHSFAPLTHTPHSLSYSIAFLIFRVLRALTSPPLHHEPTRESADPWRRAGAL